MKPEEASENSTKHLWILTKHLKFPEHLDSLSEVGVWSRDGSEEVVRTASALRRREPQSQSLVPEGVYYAGVCIPQSVPGSDVNFKGYDDWAGGFRVSESNLFRVYFRFSGHGSKF